MNTPRSSSPVIGISTWNNGAYRQIETWLRRYRNDISFVELGAQPNPDAALMQCSGLILPGGGDPAPHLYGMDDPGGLCAVDEARDMLELSLIRTALQHSMPILGICRGLQLMNVALGGTLIMDLPSVGITGHQTSLTRGLSRRSESSATGRGDASRSGGVDSSDAWHDIRITPGSHLHKLTGLTATTVNSNHHQGIGNVAPLLTPTAAAPDGMIEALEWNTAHLARNSEAHISIPSGMPSENYPLSIINCPFLLLVHWHPERMEEGDPCSKAVALGYLEAMEEVSRQ